MFTHFMIMAMGFSLLHPCTAQPVLPTRVTVALLPQRQEPFCTPVVSDGKLATMLLIEMTRSGEFQLIEPCHLQDGLEEELIDHAVLELSITDSLTHTFGRLDSMHSRTGRRIAYEKTARRLGADLSVELDINKRPNHTEVIYRLTNTHTNRVELARSLLIPDATPRDVASETAKRLTRDLWRVHHRNRSVEGIR